MCLLAVSVKKKIDNKEWLENAFINNSHGVGFAWSDGKNLYMQKGFRVFEHFYEEYELIPNNVTTLVHFRYASTGLSINNESCHPFAINSKMVFAHNGTIKNIPILKDHSDTSSFNELFLKPLITNSNFIKPAFSSLLEMAIGEKNKLVFLNNRGEHFIVNEKMGHWRDNIWFSNDSYKMTWYEKQYSSNISQAQFVGLDDNDYDAWFEKLERDKGKSKNSPKNVLVPSLDNFLRAKLSENCPFE